MLLYTCPPSDGGLLYEYPANYICDGTSQCPGGEDENCTGKIVIRGSPTKLVNTHVESTTSSVKSRLNVLLNRVKMHRVKFPC